MRVPDEDLLDAFRAARRCDLCGLPIYDRAEPHHVYPKGAGSGSRVDIRENIMAVHRNCHASIEAGNVHREVCWLIVALREGKTPEEVKTLVYRIVAAPKDAAYINGVLYPPQSEEAREYHRQRRTDP